LKLGIYYSNILLIQALSVTFLQRKNRETRFFLFRSMPNFNFAKVLLKERFLGGVPSRVRYLDGKAEDGNMEV